MLIVIKIPSILLIGHAVLLICLVAMIGQNLSKAISCALGGSNLHVTTACFRLQNLSLRHCGVTDAGAEKLGKSLGNPQKYNLKLLSLNLTGNRITDVGAEHLAKVSVFVV